MKKRFDRIIIGLAAILAASACLAQTPDWPTRPLRLVIGYPPGSSPDVTARLLIDPLARALGQPVVVENRPGAGGAIGTDATAKATDGHTIGVAGNGPLTTAKLLNSKLAYDPTRDLAPLAIIGTSPLVWVTAKGATSAPVDIIAQARAAGDKLAYGSIGAGSGGHLGMELIKEQLGLKALHVPYPGGPQILTAIIGGTIHMTLLPPSTVMPQVTAGRLEAIAVSSAKRSPLAPTLPSMEEVGAKGVDIEVWNAIVAPATLPAAHQARLSQELGRIIGSREIRQALLLQGWKDGEPGAAALARRIQSDTRVYADLIAKKGIRTE
ncbi:MAG: Bug family tripartite tricarboxylate transporter substrate binding protein [Burkholderiales bacterium]